MGRYEWEGSGWRVEGRGAGGRGIKGVRCGRVRRSGVRGI